MDEGIRRIQETGDVGWVRDEGLREWAAVEACGSVFFGLTDWGSFD